MKKLILLTYTLLVLVITLNAQQNDFPQLTGTYLGQKPPGNEPELFAPGIISTGMHERDVAMTPDGNEFYYSICLVNYEYNVIMRTRQVNGRWTEPEVAPFSGNPEYKDIEPFISPDGQRFYFASNRPDTLHGETKGDWDIWVMKRENGEWGAPTNLGPPVNSDDGEFFPSVTQDGTLYFTRGGQTTQSNYIYCSRLVSGQYEEPQKLGSQVNSTQNQYNAFIAPDESYLIVPVFGRSDSYGGTDYYICFRNEDDTWSGPVNMGDKINTPGGLEWSPYVSPDGKFFFFMSTRSGQDNEFKGQRLSSSRMKARYNAPQNGNPDIYWVSAKIIEELKPKQ